MLFTINLKLWNERVNKINVYFSDVSGFRFVVSSLKMTAAEESAAKSSAAIHKVKVVSPFISDTGATTSHDEEQQQVRLVNAGLCLSITFGEAVKLNHCS